MNTMLTIGLVWIGASVPMSLVMGLVIRAGDTEHSVTRGGTPLPVPVKVVRHLRKVG